jgi:uncharacterized membrane protein YhaH (DUF805 family)
MTMMQEGGGEATGGIGAVIFMLFYLAIIVFVIAGMWKTYAKAGKPGWAVIVPIYNIIVLIEIAGRPLWWIILWLIPIVNFIVAIMVLNDVSKRFGRGIGTTLGLIFLPFIFYPILGFGSAEYQPA